jgi:hypothetical protein
MEVTGKLERRERENKQGSYFVIVADGEEVAVSMSESLSPADDERVLASKVGQRVRAHGIEHKATGVLLAFAVVPASVMPA